MTQPIQEPTPDRTDQHIASGMRQLFRRPAIVNPAGSGGYLQARGAKYSGFDFQGITQDGQYPGGNGASWYDGAWAFITDATSPFGGVALETTTDGDWYPFPLGNLGPQGTGFGLGLWYFGALDNAQVDIEFATVSVDEFNNTPSGPVGSTTSVLAADDFEFWGATPPGWYNNGNLNPDKGYRFDLSDAGAGWTQILSNASTFMLNSPDGTPLTASATVANPDWDESSEFDAGGGPDLWWWMRIRVIGGGLAGTGGFRVRLGQVWVYRLNSQQNFVG